jgi:ribosomal protein L20A (L18A)
MKYTVAGTMKIGGTTQTFSKEIEAASQSRAHEMVLQRLGSDHKLKRTQIEIKSVVESQ